MKVKIEESWRQRLQEEFDKPYFERLVSFVKSEYGRTNVLPPGHLIFHVFNSCPFEKVKVVILGQDPYPNPGQYYGVCFSVPKGVAIPGSLANIFKEIHRDLGKPIPTSGNLDRWVAQGVFSMNSVLTVRAHETGSHRNMGWETFTDAVIKKLSDEREHLVFMLWGSYAKEKAALIDSSNAFADALSLLNKREDTPAAVNIFCSASEIVSVSPVFDFSKLILLMGIGERTLPISSGKTESRLRQNSFALSKSICHSPSSLMPSVITSMA